MQIYYLLYFSYNLILLSIIYVLGHILLNVLNVHSKTIYGNVFIKLMLGIFTCTGTYSLFKTGFSSIQGGFIIIALFLWWSRGLKKFSISKASFQLPDSKEIKILLELFAVIVLIYSWGYYYMFGTGRGIAESPHCDMHFFSNVSTFFNDFGKETFEMNYLDTASVRNTPYHYFEMWFNAFISFLFQIPQTLACLQLLCLPFMIAIIISGIWAIMEIYKIHMGYKIFSLFIICISGLFFEIYSPIHLYWSAMLQANLLDLAIGLKISVIFFALLIFTYLLLKNKYLEACISLLFFAFASVYTFVNFIPESILLGFIFYYLKKINFRQFLIILTAAISAAIYYQLFYKITGGEFYSKVVGIEKVINELPNLSIRKRFIVSAQKIIEALLVYFPFLIFLIPLFRKNNIMDKGKKYNMILAAICLLIMYTCALLSWQFFYFVFGATEFYQCLGNPIVHLLLFFGFYFIFLQNNKTYNVLLVGILLIFSYILIDKTLEKNQHFMKSFGTSNDVEYIKNISASSLKNLRGGSFLPYERLKHSDNLSNPYYYYAGLYLNYLKPGYHITSLAIIDLPGGEKELDTRAQNTFLSNSMLYKFYKKQKKENQFVSVTQCQLDYIDTYHLSFLIVAKDMQPDEKIKERVKQEFIDKKSGERFWILK